jgi:hypothetical protein
MRVIVDRDGATLEAGDEFTSFDFVTELSRTELDAAVTGQRLGAIDVDADAEHVWFAVDALVRIAGPLADAEWQRRLDGMVGYASSRGWVDSAGRVRAHRGERS